MGRNIASWKLLEDMMLTLKKQGTTIPDKVIEDLRAAKSMLGLPCMPGSGDSVQKSEEYMANVEGFLATEAQNVLGSEAVDKWLMKLEEANAEVCEQPSQCSDKFVVGVPKGQKWVRISPMKDLTNEQITKMALENCLKINLQQAGRLVVYGDAEAVKRFVTKMTAQSSKIK
jgi:hypothetical protein